MSARTRLDRAQRLARDGKLKEALLLAADVIDTAAGANVVELKTLSPDSLLIIRDLLDDAAKKMPDANPETTRDVAYLTETFERQKYARLVRIESVEREIARDEDNAQKSKDPAVKRALSESVALKREEIAGVQREMAEDERRQTRLRDLLLRA